MKNKILIRNIYRLNLQIFLKKTNLFIFHKDTYFVKNESNRQRTRYINFIFFIIIFNLFEIFSSINIQ